MLRTARTPVLCARFDVRSLSPLITPRISASEGADGATTLARAGRWANTAAGGGGGGSGRGFGGAGGFVPGRCDAHPPSCPRLSTHQPLKPQRAS